MKTTLKMDKTIKTLASICYGKKGRTMKIKVLVLQVAF